MTGLRRASIERRYLMDAASGKTYVEERVRGQAASVGSCPREVRVGLAEIEDDLGVPPPITLLQYAVGLSPNASSWRALESHAFRNIRGAAADYARSLAASAAFAELFALFAPTRVETDPETKRCVLFDDAGQVLPLAEREDAGAAEYLSERISTGGRKIRWVAGRWIDVEGALLLVATSALLDHGGEPEFIRLR